MTLHWADSKKRWKDSFTVSLAIMVGLQTIIEAFNLNDIWNWSDLFWWVRILITVGVYAVILIITFCVKSWNTKNGIKVVVNDNDVIIKSQDIFSSDGLKLIPFNEYFDTTVDDNVIAHNSLNGVFIDKYVSDISDLIRVIETPDIPSSTLKPYTKDKRKCYPLGKVIKYNNSISSIGYSAFRGCSSLSGIKIPNSVTSIGGYVFYECSNLSEIVIPNTVTSIGGFAFYQCSAMTNITLSESITSIGESTFNGCSNLKELIIPNSVTEIGGNAFRNCRSLTKMIIPDHVTKIRWNAFDFCTNLTEVTIPNSVKFTENMIFRGCSSLIEVTIPNSMNSINWGMFMDCTSLRKVIIPESITYIDGHAFEGCKSLGEVCVYATTPPKCEDSMFGGEDLFYGVDVNTCVLYVPKGSVVAYRNAYCWKDFKNILEIGGEGEYEPVGLTFEYTDETQTAWMVSGYTDDLLSYVAIPATYKGLPVTKIKESAFYECTRLTSIVIPNSVTVIGKNAFFRCSRMTSITISDSVTSIGEGAFHGCSGIKSIEFPNSLTEIGKSAFYGCTRLTSITIPDSVVSIGSIAFYGCSGLTSVEIGNSVTEIGSTAFAGCTGLTSIEIPNSVTSIGECAFENCSNLEKVIIGESVELIGSQAFYEDENIKTITVKAIVPPTCYEYAFYPAAFIENTILYVPKGTLEAYCAADGWKDFKNIVEIQTEEDLIVGLTFEYTDDTQTTWMVSGYTDELPADVVIPATYKGLPVTAIKESAFQDCTGLTSIAVPNSVTEIGDFAFGGCTDLTSIEIPNSVIWIGDGAFYKCTGLTSVTIGNSVTRIGVSAFEGCTGLTSIEIPNSVIWIGDGAFYKCTGLTSVTIGNSVTRISVSAFEGCTGLTSIEMPNSVTEIGWYAFDGCTGLEAIEIPNSVTFIGSSAFYGCSGLTSITIPESVTTIGIGAFSSCTGLTNFSGKFASDDHRCLIIDGVLIAFAPSGLSEYEIPHSVTSIGDFAFYGCTNLSLITIPNSVTEFGWYAFYDCTGLTSVEIGSSVTTIGLEAFYGCTNLTIVIVKATTPPHLDSSYSHIFDGCSESLKIYVPEGSVEAYKEAWSEWADRIYAYEEEPEPVGLTFEYTDDTQTAWMVSGYTDEIPADVVIPATYKGLPVTRIGEEAFDRNFNIISVTIPESITEISTTAFWYTKNLSSFYGKYASADNKCIILEDGTLRAFAGAGISNYNVPIGVTCIGENAFNNCTYLREVTLPNSLTKIDSKAFIWCLNIKSISIPENVVEIGDQAFAGASQLHFYGKFATDDEQCLIMYDGTLIAFANHSLPEYSVLEGVTTIGDY